MAALKPGESFLLKPPEARLIQFGYDKKTKIGDDYQQRRKENAAELARFGCRIKYEPGYGFVIEKKRIPMVAVG
jgi:hypothetical protein